MSSKLRMRPGAKNDGRRGALSLEMMGVIAIIAILVMGGLYYLSIMMRDSKVNSAISAMQLINTKVNEAYVNESSFDGLTAEKFIKTGNAPSGIINSDRTSLKSPWGTLTLEPADEEATNDTFKVSFTNVPGDVCQRLGAVVKGASNWKKVEVGGSSYDIVDNEGDSLVDFLSTNCVSGANEMVFTAKRQ